MADSRNIRGPADAGKLGNVAEGEAAHHEQQSKKNRKPSKMKELNLTSMLDVCFQLLIFFILTASFTVHEGVLPANLPFGQGPETMDEPPETPLNIALSSAGGDDVVIHLEGVPAGFTSFDELYKRLKGMRAVYDEKSPVNIKPAPAVQWGHVINAFNQARRAKFKSINFAQSN